MKRKTTQPIQYKLLIGAIIGIVVTIGTLLFLITGQGTPEKRTEATGDAQEIQMTASTRGYEPASLTVEAGKPVRWVIQGSDRMGCASALVSPQLGISRRLQPGENIIEFVAPNTSGTYPFSCSMNMYRGSITVI